MMIKATIALWNRDHEDGSYSAEHEGKKLHVSYTPEPPLPKTGPCGFSWVVSSDDKEIARSSELLEEPEMAMMQAEQAVGLRDQHGEPVKKAEEPQGE